MIIMNHFTKKVGHFKIDHGGGFIWTSFDIIDLIMAKLKVLVAQSCLTLCDPMDSSLTGSSVHRILQARILDWVAILFSRGASRPRDPTGVSYIAGGFFPVWVLFSHWIYWWQYISIPHQTVSPIWKIYYTTLTKNKFIIDTQHSHT